MSEIIHIQQKIEEFDEVDNTVVNHFDCTEGFMSITVIWNPKADWIEEPGKEAE